MKRILISIFAVVAGAAVGRGDVEKLEVVKTIEINGESFGEIYPAVWLDPMKGTIHKLVAKSEEPPVRGASIWIEPRDPEFSVGPGIAETKLVVAGFGDDAFRRLPPLAGLERVGKIPRDTLAKNGKPVIVIEAGETSAVVVIDEVDAVAGTMKLRWRRLVER